MRLLHAEPEEMDPEPGHARAVLLHGVLAERKEEEEDIARDRHEPPEGVIVPLDDRWQFRGRVLRDSRESPVDIGPARPGADIERGRPERRRRRRDADDHLNHSHEHEAQVVGGREARTRFEVFGEGRAPAQELV